ncbi:glycosyltransferase family 2 protein [Rhodohalobacter sp. 614A]|uniref:glycosyltransferase family 2 protein n=1 Tax=Rhodohalobacter sp. 614A TaxID=2908649 RepID=UPI001F3E6C48|nr:glycosyltransferase family 2 protein [Rhodohalobacter sp. 614A]
MLISVIIPTYNRAHLITEAIDSVLSQTYNNFELLVVDDYSTDNTEKVIKSYNDSRIHYLANTRKKGAQGARNTGLFAAKGEWVAMLDSDDIWLPEKLEKQIDYLLKKTKQKIVGIGCGFASYDFKNNRIVSKRIPSKVAFSRKDLLYENCIGGFSVFIFKKKAAFRFNGFDEEFTARQDLDFYISLTDIGQIEMVKDVLVLYRFDNKNRITTDFSSHISSLILFKKKYADEINNDERLKNRIHSRLFLFYALTVNKKAWQYFWNYLIGFFGDGKKSIEISNLILRYHTKRMLGKVAEMFKKH